MFTSHLTGEFTLSHYRAPTTGDPPGRRIRQGWEEIEFLTAGQGYFTEAEQEHLVGPGTILWHQTGDMTLHRNHPQKPYECLVFAFKICRKARPAPKRFTQWLDQLGVGEFVREAVSSYHHEGIDRKSLSHYIYSRLLWQTQVAHTEPKISEFPVKLQKALHYLHENWSLSGNLHEVALKADLSLPHLHHLFQKFLGTSPHRYWLNLKLREARNQLVTTAFPIKQIVEDCGFSDLVNFGRHFKSRFGTTPGAYRRDHTDVRS